MTEPARLEVLGGATGGLKATALTLVPGSRIRELPPAMTSPLTVAPRSCSRECQERSAYRCWRLNVDESLVGGEIVEHVIGRDAA